MKIAWKVLASVMTLLAACLVHAADTKPASLMMALSDIETDDPGGYATWIANNNAVAKEKLGVDAYMRVYQSVYDSRSSGRVRVATYGATVAELTKNAAALKDDPTILGNRDHMRAIRKVGARVLYQALRRDGTVKNAWVYTTIAVLTDENAYLQALDQLRSLFDANGLNDAKITVWRVIAGRSDHTHRIVIASPSEERLAALLDFTATSPQAKEWIANAAKFRTVVANGTAREITK